MCFKKSIYSVTRNTGVKLKEGEETSNWVQNALVAVFNPPEKKFSVVAEPPWQVVHLKNGAVCDTWTGKKKDIVDKDKNLNRVIFVNIKKPCQTSWGTPDKMEYPDTDTKRIVSIGANGIIAFRISNSEKFIETVLGTRTSYLVEDLREEMIAKLLSEFKDHFIDSILTNGLRYEDLDMMTKPIADEMLPKLNASFAKYGVHVEEFIINEIVKPAELKERTTKKLDRRDAHQDELQESDYELEVLAKRAQVQKQRQEMDMSGAIHQLDKARLAGKTAAEIERMGYDDAKGASYKEIREMDREDIKVAGKAAARVAESLKVKEPTIIVKNDAANTGLCPNCNAVVTASQIFCPTCKKKVCIKRKR
ncbi:MAG: SPFH domain-containing protein [Firmicutes bacterium]|nr:SPFH domain-containing protein [Bacillota bacterium]